MRAACAAILLALAAAAAGAQENAIWNARLWLTGPAFGLEEDCPVAVLFRDPPFRSPPADDAAAFRLAGSRAAGDHLRLVIQDSVQSVTLELTLHPAQGIVSVDRIRLVGPAGKSRTLTYADAAADDDDYDVYTDALVSLYRTWFDSLVIKDRLRQWTAAHPPKTSRS